MAKSNGLPAVGAAGKALSVTDPRTIDPFGALVDAKVAEVLQPWLAKVEELLSGRRQSDIVDTGGLCEYFQISPPTVKKLIADGCPFYMVGEMRRFSIGKVEAWLASKGGAP